jgi:hypothetical protein
MDQREPQDATPARPAPAYTPPPGALKALRHLARIMALAISDDGTEIWPSMRRDRYPIAGTTVELELGEKHVTATRAVTMSVFALAAKKQDLHLIFRGHGFEFAAKVPGAGKGRAREFVAAFNTHAQNL